MAETPQSLGIRHPIYLGGFTLALNPATISETPFRAETAERMADSFTVVDRPYILPGSTDVPVDVVQKFTWSFSWPSANSADYLVFARMESMPGFISVCFWKSLIETFSGDGASVTFRLMRRLANVTLSASAPAGITWTPVVTVSGTPVTPTSFGTADARGTVVMTLPSAPAAVASNVEVIYTPVYFARVVSPQRSFGVPFAESRSLQLEEV